MIKPQSNAPSPMQPWVRTTDQQLQSLEIEIAKIKTLLNGTAGVDHQQNKGLSDAFLFVPATDGSTLTQSSGMVFSGPISASVGATVDGTLEVGNPSRQEIDPVTGEGIRSIPNLEVIAGQYGNNPVTQEEFYSDGKFNTTDTTFDLNGYGQINGDGMSITLSNNGETERQNIEILGASGDGSQQTFQIANNTSNVATYTAGRYVTVTGVDPAGYNGVSMIITSVNSGVSPMTFTVDGNEIAVYNGGGYATIAQPNSIFEGKLSVQGPGPNFSGVTVSQSGVYAGPNGGDLSTASTVLDSDKLIVPSVQTPDMVVQGTRLFISETPPTAVNDGDIWIDKGGAAALGGVASRAITLKPGGTAASSAPLYFQTGSALTTPELGATEFDGKVEYFTTNTTTGRGLVPSQIYSVRTTAASLGAPGTGGSGTYSLFGTNGIQLIAGTTYEFEMVAILNVGSGGSGGTYSASMAFGSATTPVAVPTSTELLLQYTNGTVVPTSGAPTNSIQLSGTTTFPTVAFVSGGASGETRYIRLNIKGITRIGTTGYFTPRFTISSTAPASPTLSIGINSFMKLTPIGNGTVSSIGAWS